MSVPLFPIIQQELSRREAADLLTGVAALLENYPAPTVVLTLEIAVAPASDGQKSSATSGKTSKKKGGK